MGWLIGLGFAVLVTVTGVIAYQDSKEWSAFKVAQHCVKVGETSGSTAIGYAAVANGKGGMVSTYTPGKEGFKCDDGVTYWR